MTTTTGTRHQIECFERLACVESCTVAAEDMAAWEARKLYLRRLAEGLTYAEAIDLLTKREATR